MPGLARGRRSPGAAGSELGLAVRTAFVFVLVLTFAVAVAPLYELARALKGGKPPASWLSRDGWR